MLCQLSYGGKRVYYSTDVLRGSEIGTAQEPLLVSPQRPALHLQLHQLTVQLLEKSRIR